MKETVAAVIVTYNRLQFLKEIVPEVMNQTRKPDVMIVVNNDSSDGTGEWLKKQKGIVVVTQSNVGSSGGQFSGFIKAYDLKTDWIWTMDDDVVPSKSCLEFLLEGEDKKLIRAPIRYTPSGKFYMNDCIKFNLTNPFKSFWEKIIDENDLNKNVINAEGITFEGPLIHRSVLEKIGFPEFGFFIYGDDSEYFIRAKKSGFLTVIYSNAVLFRKLEYIREEQRFSWKYFYEARNLFAIDVLHGNIFVRILRPLIYLCKFLIKCRKYNQVKITFKAFFSGYFYKSRNNELI